MRIGELARLSGASARSLRYYEQQGLLRPQRTSGSQRVYDDSAVERVTLIRRLIAAALPTSVIADVLPCIDAAPEERTGALLDALRHESARLARQINEASQAREMLTGLITTFDLPPEPLSEPNPRHTSVVEPGPN